VSRSLTLRRVKLLALMLAVLQPGIAAEGARHLANIAYATGDGRALALDLHLPADVASPALVVYVHGGAWRDGDKSEYPEFLVARGYAVASVDFRSSGDARFPANVHDIKAAIRFLRAQASQYGYRSARIAIAGSSSGGHLAALVGTTNGLAELEGTSGEYLRESSAVQAIVSWFGASNVSTILMQSTTFGRSMREPALRQLLGTLPEENPALGTLASPVTHVGPGDPPAMLLHGALDRQMPVNQSLELEAAYRSAGLPVETMILAGTGHGGEAFYSGEAAESVVAFLRRTIGF
jgi:acetyl esterase/lipase